MEGRPQTSFFSLPIFLIILFLHPFISENSYSMGRKSEKEKALEKQKKILKTLPPQRVRELKHITNITKIFKKISTPSDFFESFKRNPLLQPFPPQLGKRQTPFGFELTSPLGGTDWEGQDHRWCHGCHSQVCCLDWKISPGKKGRPVKYIMQLKYWNRFRSEPPFIPVTLQNVRAGSVVPLRKNILSANIPFSGYNFQSFSYYFNKGNRHLLYRFRVKSWLPSKSHLLYQVDSGRWSSWSPSSKIIGWNSMTEQWQNVKVVKKGAVIKRINFDLLED
jgi:hypothetical protein